MTKENIYNDFCTLSENMLKSAKEGDWGQLAATEKRRLSLLSVLKKTDERQKKAWSDARGTLQKIMALDKETMHHIQNKMTSLKKKAHTERKLIETYGMASIS